MGYIIFSLSSLSPTTLILTGCASRPFQFWAWTTTRYAPRSVKPT